MRNVLTKTLFALPVVAVTALFGQATFAKVSTEIPVEEKTPNAVVLKKCMQENINDAYKGEQGFARMSRASVNADTYEGVFKAIKFQEDGQEVIAAELGTVDGLAVALVTAAKSDPANPEKGSLSGVLLDAETLQQIAEIGSGDEAIIEKAGLAKKAAEMADKIRQCAQERKLGL